MRCGSNLCVCVSPAHYFCEYFLPINHRSLLNLYSKWPLFESRKEFGIILGRISRNERLDSKQQLQE